MNVKFSNAPIAEAAAAFFGTEKRGSGLLAAWTGRPDPSLTYSLMFTKDAYYNGGRAPVPPELEAAIKELRASEDIEVRRKAFATMQRLVMENALVAPSPSSSRNSTPTTTPGSAFRSSWPCAGRGARACAPGHHRDLGATAGQGIPTSSWPNACATSTGSRNCG